MKQRFLSIILCITLMASVIAGAISVSIKSASADQPSSDDTISFSEIMTYLGTTGAFTQEQLQAFDDYVRPKISDIEENENYLVSVIEDNGSYAISLFMKDPRNGNWLTSGLLYGSYELGISRAVTNNYCIASLRYVPEFPQYNFCQVQNNLTTGTYFRLSSAYNFNISGTDKYLCMGTPFDFAIPGRHCYWSKDVSAGTFNWGTSFSYIKNLTIDPPGPVGFNLAKFQIGVQTFLTIEDQSFMYHYKDYSAVNMDGVASWISMLYFNDTDEDPIGVQLLWHDAIPIRDIGFYNSDITEIAEDGIGYAWKVDPEWFAIYSFNIYYKLSGSDPLNVARAVNIPFYIEPVDYDIAADEALSDAWQQFNTYVENYNTTHVIPEQLGDWLFETNGSKLFPCSVQVPTHIWYNKFNTTSAPDNHIWRWGGSLIQEEAFQYSLYDVVIVGESDSGYGIRYFYDDTLDPSYNYIDEMLFANLIDSFDVVIIVPESEGILYDIPGVNIGPVGYTGSSSAGVVYTNDPLVGNTLQGFCILTERAIAKQQLWNFNDGITKLYDLEVQYIDSEDKWKDSFLLWSSGVFDMLNTLDGRLSSILVSINSLSKILDSISQKLDEIAENTSEDDPGYWFISFYNWVKRWEPSNSDFANWVDSWDDFTDDLPDPGSGVTVIPFPTSIPTAAIAGG